MALRQCLTLVKRSINVRAFSVLQNHCMAQSDPGAGAGKGGGSGGSVREAGGSMGKRQAALEDSYFRKQQEEQLKALRESVEDEIKHHREQIEEHKEEIERHEKKMKKLSKLAKDD